MPTVFDTIVACITAPEGGAVAVLRLSGPESWEIAGHVFPSWPKEVVPRLAVYGKYTTGDDGIALPFEAGHSYTGEESAELSIHGSRASVRSLVEACVKAGARVARPGEFTERAFLNGRFDLTQAEAVRDTVEAATERQLRHANRVRAGILNRQVSEIRSRIADVLARIEATVDFSEEIGELDRPAAIGNLREAQTYLEQLRATAETGRILRRGLRIAIVGPPNSGKSSLLNALLGFDRSIVTDIPGTTRDFVEEAIDLGGVPCVLVDTAGLRESEDSIERMGIERSRLAARSADIVWYVYDGSTGWRDEDEAASNSGLPVQVLANKSDLPRKGPLPKGALAVSALRGSGLADLIATVSGLSDADRSEAVCINERHAPLINAAIFHIASTQKVLLTDLPVDLATVHIHAALDAMGQITGETASADMLEEIFRTFCIGK